MNLTKRTSFLILPVGRINFKKFQKMTFYPVKITAITVDEFKFTPSKLTSKLILRLNNENF